MSDDDLPAIRSSFRSARDGFVELVDALPRTRLDEPALGQWCVRDLVGHASRALSTIEEYCGREGDGPPVEGPAAYFASVGAAPSGSDARRRRDESIAQRGRAAGAVLGDDPAAAIRALAARVGALVDASGDDTPVATAVGQMTLRGYLPTRTFELVVHSLDLAGACGLAVPEVLGPAIIASTVLAGEIASRRRDAATALLALCGRGALPEGYSVV